MKNLALLTLLLLAGCASDPLSNANTDNPNVRVDLLFKHEGCSIYRFNDAGYYHYYTVCGHGVVATTSSQVPAGKTVRIDEVPTVRK